MGENRVPEAPGHAPGKAEGDLLATDGFLPVGEVAMGSDPRAQARLFLTCDLHQDRPAGVVLREIADDPGVLQQPAGALGVDHEIHQGGVGAGLVLLP